MEKIKRVDLSKLTPEQRKALGSFYADCQAAAPHMKAMQEAAQKVFRSWLQSAEWTVQEGQKPDQIPSQVWSVKPQINYVDHIEGAP